MRNAIENTRISGITSGQGESRHSFWAGETPPGAGVRPLSLSPQPAAYAPDNVGHGYPVFPRNIGSGSRGFVSLGTEIQEYYDSVPTVLSNIVWAPSETFTGKIKRKWLIFRTDVFRNVGHSYPVHGT